MKRSILAIVLVSAGILAAAPARADIIRVRPTPRPRLNVMDSQPPLGSFIVPKGLKIRGKHAPKTFR
jgi:hypothetical protein